MCWQGSVGRRAVESPPVDTTLVCPLHSDGRPRRSAAVVDGVALTAILVSAGEAKARDGTPLRRRRVEQAWCLRWGSLSSCVAVRAVAMSLLELPGVLGADGDTPASHEVERDFVHACLA